MPIKRSTCWKVRRIASADCSEPSSTAAIQRCCIPTPRSCRSAGRSGRAGTTSEAPPTTTPKACPTVTYWMNSLQNIPHVTPLFVTLNPPWTPRHVLHREIYEHPLFDSVAIRAQQQLWSLQGRQNTWYCGAYFGAGFHEDGLQAGLAVAEALGGVRRPWNVVDESGRIALGRTAEQTSQLGRAS